MRGYKFSTESFIERAKEVHTSVEYDYSLVQYIHSQQKVTIIDPVYGEFSITPNNFLSNHGHPKRFKTKPKTTEEFIKQAKEARSDIDFDYSKVQYVNSRTKVIIIDPVYGEFTVLPKDHIRLKNSRHPLHSRGNKSMTKSKFTKILKNKFE